MNASAFPIFLGIALHGFAAGQVADGAEADAMAFVVLAVDVELVAEVEAVGGGVVAVKGDEFGADDGAGNAGPLAGGEGMEALADAHEGAEDPGEEAGEGGVEGHGNGDRFSPIVPAELWH